MTDQVVINSAAILAAAAKVERLCPNVTDPARWVEGLVLSVLADGYRRIERVPDLRPAHIATEAQRTARLAQIRQQLDKRNRQEN